MRKINRDEKESKIERKIHIEEINSAEKRGQDIVWLKTSVVEGKVHTEVQFCTI